MARIAGVNIPDKKHTVIALTAIYGIGKTRSRKVNTSRPLIVLTSSLVILTASMTDPNGMAKVACSTSTNWTRSGVPTCSV